MKTDELIKIARKCGNRSTDCKKECPFHNAEDCTIQLNKELADKLEKATAHIGKNCYTCEHRTKTHKERPCSNCKPYAYNEWRWKGDAE